MNDGTMGTRSRSIPPPGGERVAVGVHICCVHDLWRCKFDAVNAAAATVVYIRLDRRQPSSRYWVCVCVCVKCECV